MKSEAHGSKYLLRKAVNKMPVLLRSALQESGALGRDENIVWHSPMAAEKYKEYRDGAAVRALDLEKHITVPLAQFWPSRGPVWDALGTSGGDRPILVEAKAHIPEAISRIKASSRASIELINKSLTLVRKHYTRKNKTDWSSPFYQYSNRLAYHLWLRKQNGINSRLVFLYFLNAEQMKGPATKQEWQGAIRLIHAVLGLPADLAQFSVHDAFLDARRLA